MTKGPDCREVERLVLEREEAPLGTGDERLIGDHLPTCARCRDFAAARQKIRNGVSAMAWPRLPAGLDRRVHRLARHVLSGEEALTEGAKVALPRPILVVLSITIVLIAVWSSITLVDVGPGQVLADLPFAARAALLVIAQNAFMLFFAPVILRAARPSIGAVATGSLPGPDTNTRRSI